MTRPPDHVGDTLRRIRLKRRLTVTDAASLAGVTRKTWASYEQSDHFGGHTSLLKQVLEAMNDQSPLTLAEISPFTDLIDPDFVFSELDAFGKSEQTRSATDPSPYTASAHSLLDAVIALLGPKATLGILNQTLAAATAGPSTLPHEREPTDQPGTHKARPLSPEHRTMPPPPEGAVAIHQAPVITDDGAWEVRVYQRTDPAMREPQPQESGTQGG